MNRKRFEGKVALVTGAGSPRGIGRATALALAREGAKVTITDVVAENVTRVASELTEISQAIGEVVDVRDNDQMVRVINRTKETFGGLDSLVNVAGLTRPTLFLDTSEEEYDLVLDVNLKGTFLTTQAAVPAMCWSEVPAQLSPSLQYPCKEGVAFLVHPPTARPKPE